MPFNFPSIYDFPPFFTQQLNPEIWKKQRQIWCDLVLEFCKENKLFYLQNDSEIFNNKKIGRKLTLEVSNSILDFLCKEKKAKYMRGRYRILWRSVDEWADLIFSYAQISGFCGNNVICTGYELLYSSEGQEFHEIDESVMLGALEKMESNGKVQLIRCQKFEEIGIKFF